MLEIRLIGPCGIVVMEGTVAIGIGIIEPIEFGEDDGLNHGEAAFRTIAKVAFGLFAVQAMEQFPCGIAQPEERLAGGGDQETRVVADLESGKTGRGGRGLGEGAGERKGREKPRAGCEED
jgi:hypothetical protein